MAVQYRLTCQFDGKGHHPEELINVPIGAPESTQVRLCLEHAEQFLKHLIDKAECTYRKRKTGQAA